MNTRKQISSSVLAHKVIKNGAHHPSTISLKHKFPNTNLKILNIHTKHSLILCKSSTESPDSQTRYNNPESNSNTQLTVVSELEGVGAAAPTRGDRFLERLQAVEAAQLVLKEEKKTKKKKKDKVLNVNKGISSCYGCGAPLQTLDLEAPGYVELDTYELKKKHHQLRTVICRRCDYRRRWQWRLSCGK